MSWRLAQSLETLRDQIDEAWPHRSKVSDGSIGDTDHANRTSDHNPWCSGVVTAIDVTHDPGDGADMAKIAEDLRESKDSRIKYVIFKGRMFSSYVTSSHPAWTWRSYSGVNAHAQHMHVSVQCNTSKDSTEPWSIGKEWDEMATKAEIREVVKEEVNEAIKKLAVGKAQEGWNPDRVNLKAVLEKK